MAYLASLVETQLGCIGGIYQHNRSGQHTRDCMESTTGQSKLIT